ncbi:MAG: formylglycine-generating enzyme family protein [Anaerolineae bacterium]
MVSKERSVFTALFVTFGLASLILAMIHLSRGPAGLVEAAGAAPDASEEVYIPAGEFLMGCAADIWSRCDLDTQPMHAVYLDAYYIDKTEVTASQYVECVAAGVCPEPEYKGASLDVFDVSSTNPYPITHVTWDHADTYCRWAGKRLPTEAEWEKAAHGPSWQIYPWGTEAPTCELLNFNRCEGRPMPVGSYPEGASPYGLLDMAGNVREWVSDFYRRDYYSRSPYFNPQGPEEEITVGEHLLRGGSWKDDFGGVTTWIRFDEAETHYIYKAGFRCARSATGGGTPTPTLTPTPTPTPTPYAAQTLDDEGGAVWLARPERLAFLEVAPRSLTQTTEITLTYSDLPVSHALSGIDHAFRIQAESGAPGSVSAQDRLVAPAAVLVTFPSHTTLISGTVNLYRLDGGTWITDGITLIEQGMNYLHARIDYAGVYAILGRTNRLYLPMTTR